jgi:hypothetical protein
MKICTRSTAVRASRLALLATLGAGIVTHAARALDARYDDAGVAGDLERWATLDGPLESVPDGRGDRFLNFDANWRDGKDHTSKKLDWPINLIFVSRDPSKVSTSRVKAVVATSSAAGVPAFVNSGSEMHALLEQGGVQKWDTDRGRKLFDSTCDSNGLAVAPDRNFHFRVYGPDREGKLFPPDYGYFVVASSHIDFRENCKDGWSGESEEAEGFIANAFAQRNLWVERNRLPLGNPLTAGVDRSDGYATIVHLDVPADQRAGSASQPGVPEPDGEGKLEPAPGPRPPPTSEQPPRNGCVYIQYCDQPNHPAGTVCRTYPGCGVDQPAIDECLRDTRSVCGSAKGEYWLCNQSSDQCRVL